ncbi:hypothetical protein N7495_003201 [Penicillium taxi]|uniref:uncharacterized protein n=1 Tax=Penicillium taxi TaxID=168475 RepID=UPI002544F419|nr:uncharacterized protein N7495_003201 [Penicillium taxi]KAJ5902673.1 hypothetical protein N7495_003201 [Penicillium taxi]
MASEFSSAMTTRSLRVVRAVRTIHRTIFHNISATLASPGSLPGGSTPVNASATRTYQHSPPPTSYSPPVTQMANTSLNEKTQHHYQAPSPAPAPPPAYPHVPQILSLATALYAYAPTDAGDLALQPNDRVQVIEHMNDDWWRGRNERTGQEGIFPRSYVNILNDKAVAPPPPSNYGNMPLEVSQGEQSAPSDGKNKFNEGGKKFGKKLGNAAVFGAGATIGSNIVNSIF